MKNRPLFYGCLILFLSILLCVYIGGAKVVKELRPSAIEREISEGSFIRITGQVYDIDLKDSYQILYLKNNSITFQNDSFKEFKMIVYDKEKLNIEIGNQIQASGRLAVFEQERNPGCFNQQLYYQRQNIHASVWADSIEVNSFGVLKMRQHLYEIRCLWKESLCEIMGMEDGAILSAMLLAEKSGMNEETKELYQVNGVAHVLAISGLHLSVIGIGLYKFFRRMSGSFFIGGVSGMLFLLLYIFMIGVSVSVLRALIMFLFRVGADMAGRHYDNLTAIAVAAMITILWQPLCLYDGGFWLSYGAILGIILILPVFEGLPFQGIWVSVSVNCMTLPVILYYFYEVPLYGVLLNLLIVPLMSVILMSGLAGSICCLIFIPNGPFGEAGLGGILLWICKVIFWIYERVCEVVLEFPCSRVVVGKPEIWKVLVYYGCLVFTLVIMRKVKKVIFVTAGIMALAAGTLMVSGNGRDTVMVTMLDVGQGDGIFVRGPTGKTYLIDSGSSNVDKLSKYQLEPFLKSQGVKEIDYVLVSHGDKDHISGIVEMIGRMRVGVSIKTIVLPQKSVWDEELKGLARIAIRNDMQVVVIEEGQRLREKELSFTCVSPVLEGTSSECYENGNESSMVLALQYKGFDMLFTGDVEENGEEILTEVLRKEYGAVNWDVLKVAHHGSKNSSSELFLDQIKPRYAVISAGRNNFYGHPHEDTLKRLEDVGSKVYSTQDKGAITIVTDGEKMMVEGYL